MPVVSVGQLTITDVNDGLNLVLSNESHNIPTDAAGNSPVFTGAVSSAKVLAGGTDVTSSWTITAVSSVGVSGTFSNNTYTVTGMTVDVGTVDFTATKPGQADLTARFTLTKSKKGDQGNPGLDGLTIVVGNESHTLPANSSGTVSSYANSGTTIRVYEGSVELNAVSGASSNGSFGIGTPSQLPASTITVGATSYSGKIATVAAHSAMVAGTDSVVITYPITIKRANGTVVSTTKSQTLTKSKQGGTGGPGPTGPRGSVHLYKLITGSVWSDAEANALFASGQPSNPLRVADRVTLYNSSAGFSQTRAWTGSAWQIQTEVLDGNLLVTKSVTSAAINTADLYAQNVDITGSMRVGNDTNYVQLGGDTFIRAQAGQEVLFSVPKTGRGLLQGAGLVPGSVLPEALSSAAIQRIRDELGGLVPEFGGTQSISQYLQSGTYPLSAINSDGTGVEVSFFHLGADTYSLNPANPSVTISVRRGSTIIHGQTFTGASIQAYIGPGGQMYRNILPVIDWKMTDATPGTGSIVYSVVVTVNNYPGGNAGNFNFVIIQSASGGDVVAKWDKISGKPVTATRWPAFSEVTGTAAAAQIPNLDAGKVTTGVFAAARIPTLNQNTTGNAATATALQTARTINGTSFNGSANITTANWGTARTLTVGNTGKSINGSGNVSWSLAEIGAPSLTGAGASGSWGISITGNAATASALSNIPTTYSGTYPLTVNVSGTLHTRAELTYAGSTQTLSAGKFSGDGSALTNLNASNMSSGILPDARLSGTYSGFTHKIDGSNTVFTTPSSGTANTLARTVYGLAEFRSNASSAVGAIVFKSPTSSTAIMMQLEIAVMLYSSARISHITVQGYRSNATAYANLLKISKGTFDVQVRFATEVGTGKTCIILGNESSTWSYPHLSVIRAMFSHGNITDAFCTGWTTAIETTLTGYENFTADIPDSAMVGSITGNAASATVLQTARSINGTNFNGSANITTSNWGTARTLTIGNTGKSVNGSGNVSWSLAEIGAAAASHTHNVTDINASGNRSGATFLRGDGVWAAPEVNIGTTVRTLNSSNNFFGDIVLWGTDGISITEQAKSNPSGATFTFRIGTLTAGQIPNLDAGKVTTGVFAAARIPTGISITGNAGTVTNGVYTTGTQSIVGNKTFTSWVGLSDIRGDSPVSFLTTTGGAREIRAGKLLVSDSYTDGGLVPANGIYTKGQARLGSAQIDGQLNIMGYVREGAYRRYTITLPNPGAGSGSGMGNGRWFLRVYPVSGGAGFIGGRIRVAGGYSYGPAFGVLEREFSVYTAQNATSVNMGESRISAATGFAATNYRISEPTVVGGWLGFYIWSQNSNSAEVLLDVHFTGATGTIPESLGFTAWQANTLPAFEPVTFTSGAVVNGTMSATTVSATNLSGNGSGVTNVNAATLSGFSANSGASGSTIAVRDSAADVTARLFRSTYQNQNTISGGLAYRVSTTDNYIRFCNDQGAIRAWLNVPNTAGLNASGTWGISISGTAATATTVNYQAKSNQNLNTAAAAGKLEYFEGSGMTGAPNTGWHSVLSVRHNNGANLNGFQFAYQFGTDNFLVRGTTGSSYRPWLSLYTDNYHPEADKWTNARTLTVGNTGKSVDGSGNVSWSLAEIGAEPRLFGMPAPTNINWNDLPTSYPFSGFAGIMSNTGTTNNPSSAGFGSIYHYPQQMFLGSTGAGANVTQIAWPYRVDDDRIGIRSRFSGTWSTWREILTSISNLNASNLASGTIPTARLSGTYSISISGNASTATTLQTARTINGTNFNGSANITTANWGTARTLTIGSSGKSVNGSGNVSWTLAEIGAFPASGGTLTGLLGVPTIVATGGEGSYNATNFGSANLGAINIRSTSSGNTNAITFSNALGANAQAGIYVNNNNSSGTTMHLATTNSFAVGPQARMTLLPNGNIGIGTISPTARLHVNGGDILCSGNISAFSDLRLKSNVRAIPDALRKLCAIRGVTFDRKDIPVRQAGVIAQEVEAVLPEVVSTDEKGMKSVAYGNLVSLLIEAVKELTDKVNRLEAKYAY